MCPPGQMQVVHSALLVDIRDDQVRMDDGCSANKPQPQNSSPDSLLCICKAGTWQFFCFQCESVKLKEAERESAGGGDTSSPFAPVAPGPSFCMFGQSLKIHKRSGSHLYACRSPLICSGPSGLPTVMFRQTKPSGGQTIKRSHSALCLYFQHVSVKK